MVSLPQGSQLGRYQILDRIGRGGMATVFRAHDPELDRYVAVKVLPSYQSDDPTFVSRFRQEAQAVAKLSEPSIIQVHDFGEDKGFNYIVMEYLTGGTLHERLGNAWQISDVLAVIRPIANGLDYAHSEGVIHRDIKPPNILIDSEGRPKLSDFGLALLVQASAGLTKSDSVLGTPEYMSPEQALGRPADNRSDLYSLAIVIYQMLLGQIPFRGDTPNATLLAHIHESVPLPSSLDTDFEPRLEAALLKGLAKDPDDRYSSGNELIKAFTEAPTQSGSEAELDQIPTMLEPVPAEVSDSVPSPSGIAEPPKTRPPASSVVRRDMRLSDHCLVSDVPDSSRLPINLRDPKTLLWVVDPQKHFNGIRGLAWRIVGVKRDQRNPNTCNVCAFHFDAGHLAEISVLVAGSENLSNLVRDVGPEKASQSVREFYDLSSGPHHQDSGEAKIRESTAGVSRKPSSDGKACGCSSKHLCGLTAWNT